MTTRNLGVPLDPAEYERIRVAAARDGVSMAQYAREALEARMAQGIRPNANDQPLPL